MRFALAFALTLACSGPALAQIDDDFAMANRIFGQISAASVVADIDGEWLPLSTIANLEGADPDPGLITSYLERICGNDPARGFVFTGIDEASFEMAVPNAGHELVYRLDWMGGAQFHRSFDPAAMFSAFGFDSMEGERGMEMRASALRSNTNLVDFYRVSPDLLAMATPQRVEIYGRCPG
ncbi:MAG: hypothetical protein P0Y65_14730 [Candidatus Devosia phytovorans]|uniref:Uncharacterized protein n=1 Tax=Candidatus Devosia phytovorans TaxID=3121372 RepID=A0AAJ6B0E3_9HYPH|nr:hypothetical protein [Devosia sp.]WEK03443.1 MAG: hypothetical protein P0Y65_14730 [Devosia sp.]